MPPSESNPRFRPWSKLLFFVLAKLVFNAILVATILIILAQSDAWPELPLYKSWRNTMLNYRLYGDRHLWTADLTGKQFGQVKQI